MIGENLLRFKQDTKYIIFDAETFNLNLNFCHNVVWQFSMLKVVGDKEVDARDIIVKWDTKLKIRPDIARMNHYSDERIQREGVAPEKAFAQIHEWFSDMDYCIAHNGHGFDMFLVKEWYELMGNKYWKTIYRKLIDTNLFAKGIKTGNHYKAGDDLIGFQMKMYHHIQKKLKTGIKALTTDYQIPYDETKAHDGLYDCRLLLQIWNKIKWQVEI